MSSPRLMKFLAVLSPEEWASFIRFLKADFLVSPKEKSLPLVEWFHRRHKKSKLDQLSDKEEKAIQRQLFGDELAPDKAKKAWDNLLSATTLHLENFLAIEALMKDERQRQLYVAQSMQERQDDETFEISLGKLGRKQAEAPQSIDTYDYEWRILEMEADTAANDEYLLDATQQPLLCRIEEACIASFHLKLLKVRTIQRSSQQFIQLQLNKPILDNETLLAQCEGYDAQEHPLIDLYRQCLKMSLNPNDIPVYQQFLQTYLSSSTRISHRELVDLGLLALNYAFKYHAQNLKGGFTQDMARITDAMTELLNKSPVRISDQVFINFSLAFISVKEYEKYNKLKSQLSKRLSPLWQEMACKLTDGYYYFYQKKYPKALECLEEISSYKFRYSLRAQSLLLRIRLEIFLENPLLDEELTRRLDSFRMFINRRGRKTLSETRKIAYENLYWFVSEIKRIKLRGTQEAEGYTELLHQLSHKQTHLAAWLENKLKELIRQA